MGRYSWGKVGTSNSAEYQQLMGALKSSEHDLIVWLGKVQKIRDLHVSCAVADHDGEAACKCSPPYCVGCDQAWPCETIRILDDNPQAYTKQPN